jgi:methionyl-tRNA synthetase
MTEKILITSALPYVNNVPHLGNIIGCVLSADVFARFCRSIGKDCIYICGTDEYGTATETKAIEEGLTPKEICDKYHKIHKEIYEWFNISFDYFGRTSTKEQTELTQEIFLKLYENGFIKEEEVEQHYCEKCQKFLADRFVEGNCPYCNYEDARGDQCDSCGKIINAIDLKNPRCKICSSNPIIKKSMHLFIDLPKIEPMLKEWLDKRSNLWSQNAKTITYAWLKEGIKKRAITRDLKWGIPVPLEKYKNKVFYVWFDAPIGYLSITKNAFPNNWDKWWKDDSNVKLYQFMAKDNIPFHTIIFPSSLIGTKDNYTMLYKINSTEYLNYEDSKFSKSRGVGLFGNQAKETGISSDVFRYYLLINRPEKSDSSFSWIDLMDKNNNELCANLGNLVNRTITFIKKFFDGKIPKADIEEKDKLVLQKIKNSQSKVKELLEKVEIKEALKEIMTISKIGNQYFQECEPWHKIKSEPKKAQTCLNVLSIIIKDIAIMIEPYLPDTSTKIFKQLNLKKQDWNNLGIANKEGININEPEILFQKIEEKEIKRLKEKYSGKDDKKKEDTNKNKNIFPLNIKSAKILSAKEHENSDKLLILQIDLGYEKRQLVAGLKEVYKPEELVGKKIVILSNLKPAKIRGEVSQGMILASEKDGIVKVNETDAYIGDTFLLKGYEENKKEITYEQFSKIKLKIKDKKITYNGFTLKTKSNNFAGADMPDESNIR